MLLNKVADPHHLNSDPDLSFHQSDANLRQLVSVASFWASTPPFVSVNCPPWLHFEPLQNLKFVFNADPDPTSRNNADPESQPCCYDWTRCTTQKLFAGVYLSVHKSLTCVQREISSNQGNNLPRDLYFGQLIYSAIIFARYRLSFPTSGLSLLIRVFFTHKSCIFLPEVG